MNVKDILKRAVHCDQAGRILEAQNLYQDGVQILLKVVASKENVSQKKVLYEHIKEYSERAEQITARVEKLCVIGEVLKRLRIDQNSTGNSYKSLFGQFLDGKVIEVLIEEPYLQQDYQLKNLVMCLELMVKKCRNLKYVRLVTKTYRTQVYLLQQIKQDMTNRNIPFSIDYQDKLHDRQIVLSNGIIIKIGRGLHIFSRPPCEYCLGLYDFDFRKCLLTDLDIYRTKDCNE